MAPLVPPPPALDLEQARAVEAAATVPPTGKRALLGKDKRVFSGREFVEWVAQFPHWAKDAEAAVKAGQALLEHRLAHHVTDDADFEPTEAQKYAFISTESFEVKAAHAALSQMIAQPGLYHQGKLKYRSSRASFFSGDKWEACYGVLDPVGTVPRCLHLFKRFSAASPPFASYAIEDCMCSMQECANCLTDWYCFTLVARRELQPQMSAAAAAAPPGPGSLSSMSLGGSIRALFAPHPTSSRDGSVTVTLCADHSKRQEGWLQALMDAGVAFEKEDLSSVSAARSIFDFSARALNSQELVPLSKYKGQVCLVVNVASK